MKIQKLLELLKESDDIIRKECYHTILSLLSDIEKLKKDKKVT